MIKLDFIWTSSWFQMLMHWLWGHLELQWMWNAMMQTEIMLLWLGNHQIQPMKLQLLDTLWTGIFLVGLVYLLCMSNLWTNYSRHSAFYPDTKFCFMRLIETILFRCLYYTYFCEMVDLKKQWVPSHSSFEITIIGFASLDYWVTPSEGDMSILICYSLHLPATM